MGFCLRSRGRGERAGGAAAWGPIQRQTHVFYETPHRILEALADLAGVFGEAQHVVVARELTKLHEEFCAGPAEKCGLRWLGGRRFEARWCSCFIWQRPRRRFRRRRFYQVGAGADGRREKLERDGRR